MVYLLINTQKSGQLSQHMVNHFSIGKLIYHREMKESTQRRSHQQKKYKLPKRK